MGKIKKPEQITSLHALDDFDCGNEVLNEWLKKRALKNEGQHSRTRVVSEENKVIAYYTLCTSIVNRENVTRKLQQNAPVPISFILLGRLAVDRKWQGKGLAKDLLQQALLQTFEASKIVGIRGLLVHAIDNEAENFYKQFGFIESKIPLTLLMPIEDIKVALGSI